MIEEFEVVFVDTVYGNELHVSIEWDSNAVPNLNYIVRRANAKACEYTGLKSREFSFRSVIKH